MRITIQKDTTGMQTTITTPNRTYMLRRDAEGKGFDFTRSKEIGGKAMITIDDVEEIIADKRLNKAFRNALNCEREWAYALCPVPKGDAEISGSYPHAAIICHYTIKRVFGKIESVLDSNVGAYPYAAAPVVIYKA